jgi:GDPmannose 4,6-dehydratase
MTLEAFVARAFEAVGLNWREHVEVDRALYRPADIVTSSGNPTRAAERLGWRATIAAEAVVDQLVEAERKQIAAEARA